MVLIKDYVRKKIRRSGYDKSLLIDVADQYYKNIMLDKYKLIPPTSIYDMYDILSKRTGLKYIKPTWYKPYIDVLEDTIHNGNINRITFASCPRHGKTLAAKISLAYACMVLQNKDHVYVTYNKYKAADEKKEFENLLDNLGLTYHTRRDTVFVTPLSGGGTNSVVFTSVRGKITGKNLNGILFIDDVYGSMEDAMSPNMRKLIQNFYDRQVLTRGSYFSLVVMNTRWNSKDLIQLLIDRGYPHIRIPAICDDEESDVLGRKLGESLWPEMYSVSQLEAIKKEVTDFVFEAMYQGLPGTDDQYVIKNITKYNKPHNENDNIIYSYGIDLAYSGKNKSDYCAIVAMETSRTTGITHITRCHRRQTLYHDFVEDVKRFVSLHPGNIYFIAGGNEPYTSGVEFKKVFGGRMVVTNSNKNKYQKLAAAGVIDDLNAGWLCLPNKQDNNMDILEGQLTTFTGADLGPGTDDYIDAISSVYGSVKHIHVGLEKQPTDPETYTKQNNINKPNNLFEIEFEQKKQQKQNNKITSVTPRSFGRQNNGIRF